MLFRWIERLIVPLFMITAALGLVYWYWTTTPSYAIQQIVNSLRAHDVDTFTRYVDLDTMGERALDEIIHGPARDSGIFGNFDGFIGMGIVSLFKTEIVEVFKSEMTKLVAGDAISSLVPQQNSDLMTIASSGGESGGSLGSGGSGGSGGAGQALANPATAHPTYTQKGPSALLGQPRPSKIAKWKGELENFGLSKKGFKGIDYFREEHGVNLIALKFHSSKYDTDFIIEFKLEDAGGYWRVTELSNLSALVEQYLELRDKAKATAERELRDSQSALPALPAPPARAAPAAVTAMPSPAGATAGAP
jgi:hypothetical protein